MAMLIESANAAFVYFGSLLAVIVGFCLGRITADKAPMPEFKMPKVKAQDGTLSRQEDPYFDAQQEQPTRRIPTVE